MDRIRRIGVFLGLGAALALVAASCGDDGGATGSPDEGGSLTVYSGREEEFRLLGEFLTKHSGSPDRAL